MKLKVEGEIAIRSSEEHISSVWRFPRKKMEKKLIHDPNLVVDYLFIYLFIIIIIFIYLFIYYYYYYY